MNGAQVDCLKTMAQHSSMRVKYGPQRHGEHVSGVFQRRNAYGDLQS